MMYKFVNIAGWSSLVARKAHNLEVGGSNPSPATNQLNLFITIKFEEPSEDLLFIDMNSISSSVFSK